MDDTRKQDHFCLHCWAKWPSLRLKMQLRKLHHHWTCGKTTAHLLMARALNSEGEQTIRDNQACRFFNGWTAAKWWWTCGRVEELMSEATWGLRIEKEKGRWEWVDDTAVVQTWAEMETRPGCFHTSGWEASHCTLVKEESFTFSQIDL